MNTPTEIIIGNLSDIKYIKRDGNIITGFVMKRKYGKFDRKFTRIKK